MPFWLTGKGPDIYNKGNITEEVKGLEYRVKRIGSRAEILSCEKFEVSNFQWVDGPKPKTCGYMGYIPGEGLYVEMFCVEKNPKRECQDPEGRFHTEFGTRVCDDSAMEIFIGFPDEDGVIRRKSLYVNFEINANGVMYANYGKGRQDREFLTDEVYRQAAPAAEVKEDHWTVRVLFPETFLNELSGVEIGLGADFYCNFYKISETPEIEHYGTFAPVGTENPDFHVPEFFAKAVLV